MNTHGKLNWQGKLIIFSPTNKNIHENNSTTQMVLSLSGTLIIDVVLDDHYLLIIQWALITFNHV